MPMRKLISSSPWPKSNFGYLFVFELLLLRGFSWLHVFLEYGVILVPTRLCLIRKPGRRIDLSEEAEGKSLQKFEQVNNRGITVNSAFTPSANVLAAVNKTREMLYFIKRSFTCLTNEICVPLCIVLVRPHLEYAIQANCPHFIKDINHLERIQQATRWVKGLNSSPKQSP